jgi:hypothetical protein
VKKIGHMMMTAGFLAAFLMISADDYHTMELRQLHTIDWKGFLAAAAIVAAGALIWEIGNKFSIQVDIQVRRKKD